jgi:hypothetical protein
MYKCFCDWCENEVPVDKCFTCNMELFFGNIKTIDFTKIIRIGMSLERENSTQFCSLDCVKKYLVRQIELQEPHITKEF